VQEIGNHEILAERCRNHADCTGVLPDYTQSVIVDSVGKQGIAHICVGLKVGNVHRSPDFGSGYLAKIIVPVIVIGVQHLLIMVGGSQVGAEMRPS